MPNRDDKLAGLGIEVVAVATDASSAVTCGAGGTTTSTLFSLTIRRPNRREII